MTYTATWGETRQINLVARFFNACARFFKSVSEASRKNGDLPYPGL